MGVIHLAFPKSLSGLIAYACISLAVYILYLTIKEKLLSPLASVPGPFWNSLSSIPRLIDSILGRSAIANHELFEKYGPVVRLEPNLVILADPKYIKTIYGHSSSFYKTEFYKDFTFVPGDKATMSIMDNKEHAKKRALYARCMTRNSILSQQHHVQERCDAMVRAVTQRANENDGKVDFAAEMALLTHDVVTVISLGQHVNTVEAGKPDDLSKDIFTGTLNAFIGGFPAFHAILSKVPLESIQKILTTMKRLRAHGERMLADYRGRSLEEQAEYQVFHQLCEDAVKLGYEDSTIINETFSLLTAGGDTSKWLLTYLVYQVFRRPELKKRLQAELDEAMPNGDTCLSYETASNLELLNATVKELLRFHAPVPGPLPRYVPEGGDLLVDGKYVLPAGTQVALQPYTVHRDRDIFGEDADEFNPDRWLRDAQSSELMSKTLFTFGAGSRRCIGYELAWLELTLATACIVRNFDGRVATIGKAAQPIEYFVTATASGKMILEGTKRRT